MSNTILSSKTIESHGFSFILNLVSYESEGWTSFHDKWKLDSDGLVSGDRGQMWDQTWATIGTDLTVEQAQEEFDRDVDAFDVQLTVTVTRNGVTLIDSDPVIGGDYNHEEDASGCLKDLEEYFDLGDYTSKANEELKAMRKALA